MTFEQFAAERSQRLEDFHLEIRETVARALDDYGQSEWFTDIVEAASVLWMEIFEKQSPTGDPNTVMVRFQRQLVESLERTSKPDDPPTDGQIDRVARWVGVYTTNSAMYFASRDAGHLEKVWLTMDDGAVRPMHRAVDGQTAPILGTFLVGGFKLHFPGEPIGPPEVWINCRCLLAATGGPEMGTKTTSFAATAEEAVAGELTDEEIESEDLVDDVMETEWHGVLVVEGVPTGDKRQFDVGALSYRNLPLPLSFQRMSAEGHSQSVIIGTIDEIWLEENQHRARGRFNLNVPEANEVVDGLVFGMFGGVSVDIDDPEFEVDFKESEGGEDDDLASMLFGGEIALTRFTKGRICGATMVGIPAFQEAFVALGPDFEADLRDPEAGAGEADLGEGDASAEYDEDSVAFDTLEEMIAWLASEDSDDFFELDRQYSLVAAAFAPGTKDGPGWLTNPRATQRIRRYWTHGEGAAKIRWGVPGDFNRCRRQLSKYVNPAFLAGTCANMHKEALGVWPGRERGSHSSVTASAGFSLVASILEADHPPMEWFQNPELSEPTPITITDEGRVFGHIAAFGTCHLGIGERCVMPPHSTTEYSYFTMGVVETDGGPVRTGPIVMGTGHAGSRAAAAEATKHYDNTGHAVADIAVGEDKWGIWFAGKLRDDVTPQQVKTLRASTLSGDWRDVKRIGIPDELVGVLTVNVPGFPTPRPSFAMEGDRQLSLIASAGILAPREEEPEAAVIGKVALDFSPEDLGRIGRVVADELEYRADRKARLSTARDPELDELAAARRAERLAAARSLE